VYPPGGKSFNVVVRPSFHDPRRNCTDVHRRFEREPRGERHENRPPHYECDRKSAGNPVCGAGESRHLRRRARCRISRGGNQLAGARVTRRSAVAQPLRFARASRGSCGAAIVQQHAAVGPHIGVGRHAGARREGFMNRLMLYAKSFVQDEEGQDLLEYALLVALIALVAVIAVTAAGTSVKTIFTNIANELANAA
jgi:pilus assembly protein Flp/PilA